MTQEKKSRKLFAVHNYAKNCGNCGMNLYEDDDILYAPVPGITESSYFHTTYKGCEKASELNAKRMKTHFRKLAKHGG